MRVPVVPVGNGLMPRPTQEITGIFLDPRVKSALLRSSRKNPVLLCPFVPGEGLYPVGTGVQVQDSWSEQVMVAPSYEIVDAAFVNVKGLGTFKAGSFCLDNGLLVAEDVQPIDLHALRKTYPVIDGAGWVAMEGSTEARSPQDIRVEILGMTHEEEQVALSANLGGLVSAESAHTVEHAIIRSLNNYAMVTPKTLRKSLQEESESLKSSIELGYQLRMPEFFGVTSTGICGNPLTGLAHFYLADEVRNQIARGRSLRDSLEVARLKTLSKVTSDLELSTLDDLRVTQGLKDGMSHDDTPLPMDLMKKILRRFPLSPWH